MRDVIKMKICAVIALGAITLEVAKGWVGFATVCLTFMYSAHKYWRFIRNKNDNSKQEVKL